MRTLALEEADKLPKKGDELEISAHGKTVTIKLGKSRGEWILKSGSRVRWGNRAEVLKDIEYFRSSGALPPKGKMF
jgi:hypothetical protein